MKKEKLTQAAAEKSPSQNDFAMCNSKTGTADAFGDSQKIVTEFQSPVRFVNGFGDPPKKQARQRYDVALP